MSNLTIKLVFVLIGCLITQLGNTQDLKLDITDGAVHFLEGKDSVLVFQIKPKSLVGNYSRANYIHPLYSLEGTPVTEDFPEDHLHHRGVFWAWHQLYLNGIRIGDGWEIEDFLWEVENPSEVKNDPITKSLRSNVLWKSPLVKKEDGKMKPLVQETNWITVYPKELNFRVVDIKIRLLSLIDDISIGGSEDEKGYGGFSARIQLSDDVLFTDSNGIVNPENTPVAGNNWINIVSKTSQDNKDFGLVIIPSMENSDFPNPWILRKKNSMQNAVYPYPGAKPVSLSNSEPTILQYRLIIHNGALENSKISELQRQFFEQTQ